MLRICVEAHMRSVLLDLLYWISKSIKILTIKVKLVYIERECGSIEVPSIPLQRLPQWNHRNICFTSYCLMYMRNTLTVDNLTLLGQWIDTKHVAYWEVRDRKPVLINRTFLNWSLEARLFIWKFNLNINALFVVSAVPLDENYIFLQVWQHLKINWVFVKI